MKRGEQKCWYDTSSCHLKGNEKGCFTSGYGCIASKEYANRHITEVANLFDRVKI